MKVLRCEFKAIDVSEEEFDTYKTFYVHYEVPPFRKTKEILLQDCKEAVVHSVCERLMHDFDNLFSFSYENGEIDARIKIIPAIDYQPKNEL